MGREMEEDLEEREEAKILSEKEIEKKRINRERNI